MGTERPPQFDALLRTAQIIMFGLVAGVVFFMIIILVVMGSRVEPFDAGAVASIVLAAMAISMVLARLVVPGMIVESNCRKIAQGTWNPNQRHAGAPLPDTDEGKLMGVFLSKMIVGAALLEGGAFANLVAFMIEGQVYSIVLSVVLLLGIVVSFPTRSGLLDWLDNQQRRLQELRM